MSRKSQLFMRDNMKIVNGCHDCPWGNVVCEISGKLLNIPEGQTILKDCPLLKLSDGIRLHAYAVKLWIDDKIKDNTGEINNARRIANI